MNDVEILFVMAMACELFSDFPVGDIRQLLSPFEGSRFERVMSAAFPDSQALWTSLQGPEAATALCLVAAAVEAGDRPGWRSTSGKTASGP